MPSNRLQQVGDNDKVINNKNAFQEPWKDISNKEVNVCYHYSVHLVFYVPVKNGAWINS